VSTADRYIRSRFLLEYDSEAKTEISVTQILTSEGNQGRVTATSLSGASHFYESAKIFLTTLLIFFLYILNFLSRSVVILRFNI
jgi:hypothetical protein